MFFVIVVFNPGLVGLLGCIRLWRDAPSATACTSTLLLEVSLPIDMSGTQEVRLLILLVIYCSRLTFFVDGFIRYSRYDKGI